MKRKVIVSHSYCTWSCHAKTREQREFLMYHPGIMAAVERGELGRSSLACARSDEENARHPEFRKLRKEFLKRWPDGEDSRSETNMVRSSYALNDIAVEEVELPFTLKYGTDVTEVLVECGSEDWFE